MLHDGSGDPTPLAQGASTITLAPEDPLVRVSITSDSAPLAIFDARNRAQNGWFVVRSLIPAGKTRDAVVWHVRPHVVPGWTRAPVVSFNQAGYTPERDKVGDHRTGSGIQGACAGHAVAHRRRRPQRAGAQRARQDLGTVATLPLRDLRLLERQGSGHLRDLLRRAQHQSVPHRGRCLRAHLATLARHLSRGTDGPHVGARAIPGVVRHIAHGRCAPGSVERGSLRRLSHGARSRFAVQAGRAYSRPECRRLAGRRRLRHPDARQRVGGAQSGMDARTVRRRLGRDHDRRRGARGRDPQARRHLRCAAADPPWHAPVAGAIPDIRPRHRRHRRSDAAPVHASGRFGFADRSPDLRPHARSARSA